MFIVLQEDFHLLFLFRNESGSLGLGDLKVLVNRDLD